VPSPALQGTVNLIFVCSQNKTTEFFLQAKNEGKFAVDWVSILKSHDFNFLIVYSYYIIHQGFAVMTGVSDRASQQQRNASYFIKY
jgi:hypothetical protein